MNPQNLRRTSSKG